MKIQFTHTVTFDTSTAAVGANAIWTYDPSLLGTGDVVISKMQMLRPANVALMATVAPTGTGLTLDAAGGQTCMVGAFTFATQPFDCWTPLGANENGLPGAGAVTLNWNYANSLQLPGIAGGIVTIEIYGYTL